MVNTILGDIDGKREQLARQGYVIVRSVVPAGMLEHPQSVAYAQAHNRLHAQMALLEFVLNRPGA